MDDKNGNLISITYDAFGKPSYDHVWIENLAFYADELLPFMYKGYYYDTELGWYEIGSRLYDPETGRFVSPEEPTNLRPTMLGGMSPYTYCFNNHVSKSLQLEKQEVSQKPTSLFKPSLSYILPLAQELKIVQQNTQTAATIFDSISNAYFIKIYDSDLINDLSPKYNSPFKTTLRTLNIVSYGLDFYINFNKNNDFGYASYKFLVSIVISKVTTKLSLALIQTLTVSLGGPAGLIVGVALTLLISHVLSDPLNNLSDWFYNLIT